MLKLLNSFIEIVEVNAITQIFDGEGYYLFSAWI